jgi:hypothetical protein
MASENDSIKILPSPSAARVSEGSSRRAPPGRSLLALVALIACGMLTQFGTCMMHVAELLCASSSSPVRTADPGTSPESTLEPEVVAVLARSRASTGQERASARVTLMWPLAQRRIERPAGDREPPARVRAQGDAAQRIPLRC